MNIYLFVKTEDGRPYVESYYREEVARKHMLKDWNEETELYKDLIAETFYPEATGDKPFHLSLTFKTGKYFSYDLISIMV